MPDQPGDNSPASQPKIIIDSDWKAQAQKERERLAAKEREDASKRRPVASEAARSPESAASSGSGRGREPGEREMPPADFGALVGTLATQALMYLGGFPDPQTGRAIVSLEYAKFHIDLMAVLEEKTRGNLTTQDADDMKQALNELRLRYVEIAKAVEKASKEGKMRPAAAGAHGGPGEIAMGGMGGMGISGPGL